MYTSKLLTIKIFTEKGYGLFNYVGNNISLNHNIVSMKTVLKMP